MDIVGDSLVQVFKTDDSALLPLAKIALESAGIEYQTRSFGKVDNLQWTMSQTPTIRAAVLEILVASDVADQARDLLADLTQSQTVAATDPALLTDSAESQAIRLEVVDSGMAIASLTEEQLQTLGSHLEETGQQQFLVDADAIGRLRHSETDTQLVDKLEQALGDSDEITVRWAVN